MINKNYSRFRFRFGASQKNSNVEVQLNSVPPCGVKELVIERFILQFTAFLYSPITKPQSPKNKVY